MVEAGVLVDIPICPIYTRLMPIDLTDFRDVPSEIYKPAPKQEPAPVSSFNQKMKAATIPEHLIDSEMKEQIDREERNPFKKHFFNLTDFDGVPYNEEEAAKYRRTHGIKEPDEMIKNSTKIE